jgi:tetratricopeptide (TPR) repeat protein
MEVAMTSSRSSESARTLVSWKEIAVFLNHSESTVKRWERDRGLPVHRIPGGERGGVYAYPSELADWLKGTSSELEAEDVPLSGLQAATGNGAGPAIPEIPIEMKPDPEPAEIAGPISRLSNSLRVRIAFLGVAASLAAAGILSFAHPFSGWMQQHLSVFAAIGPASSMRQAAAPVSDAEKSQAHALYLKGRFEWNQRTPESLNRALDDFTQSIVHNPNDAHAYAGLADAYEMLFIYGSRQDDDARDRAMAAARKSVELDGSLAVAHRALGYALWRSRNFGDAQIELQRAIHLDPKDPLAHLWLSNVLAGQGKYLECLAEIEKAEELDPASATILAMKGERLYWIGKKDEGIALLNAAVGSEPKLSIAHLYLAEIEYLEKNYPAYLRESQATADIRNDAWLKEVTAKLSAAYARDGQSGLLNTEFAVQESCSPPLYSWRVLPRFAKAMDCLSLNRNPEALQLLEEASANHEKSFEEFRAAFASDSSQEAHAVAAKLADDPRFQALMKQKVDLPKTAKLAPPPNSGTL